MNKKIFKDKKVLVMGLGLNGGGVGVAKYFYQQGADVLVTDLKTAKQLDESIKKLKKYKKIKYTLGKHEEKDFLTADLIIKNPDVPFSSPYLEIAQKNNIPVETDVSLFFKIAKTNIIGVTGTKGKSTTATLIHHIIKTKYKNALLAGNIGISPLEILNKIKANDSPVVLELSSFELEGLKQSPHIAVITNIFPDHLNRYGTMEEYIKTKKIIFQYQTKKDFLILNNDNLVTKEFIKESSSKVIFFSKAPKIKKLKIFGEHNLYNIASAIEVARIMEISKDNIEKSIKSFKGVPNRQEFIKEVNGVKYFNDTTATMPDAAIVAIKSFKENFPKSKLTMICGGQNKGLEYHELSKEIENNIDNLVMLPGNASDIIKEYLTSYKNLHEVKSMNDAVKTAKKLAKKGDLIFLSPGAASFNLFKNEFDRGEQFIKLVKKLSTK